MNVDLLWKNFLERIKPTVNSMVYETYMACNKLIGIENDTLIIAVPDEFRLRRIQEGYEEKILTTFYELTNNSYKAKFVIAEKISNDKPKPEQASLFDSDQPLSNFKGFEASNELVYKHHSNLNKSYTFDNFVVGNSNRLAHGAAFIVAENPGKTYNPLFLYGNSGLGKTHLMHAIGNYIEEHSNKRVLYISIEEFINDYKKLGKNDGNLDYDEYFKNKYRMVDVLIVDDVQFLSGAKKTQEEFFHTFNELYNNKKQIIISSDRQPDEIKDLEDRIKTRFAWGVTFNIYPPEFELKKNIIYKKLKGSGIQQEIPEEVVEYIASNMNGNVRALENAVNRLEAYSIIMGGVDITLQTAVEALKDFINKGTSEQTDILRIQKCVADYFQISVDDLKSKKRSANIAFPRQIAMYLSRSLLDESFERIGLEFGGKDHTTVMHSCEKIKNDIRNNQEIFNSVEKIKQNLS